MSQNTVIEFNKLQLKDLPDLRTGDTVKVHQKIKEKDKYRIQIFEGLILAKKHGVGINATITVRKVLSGVGVEKTFPIHSPLIEKIEIVKRSKVRRSKIYFIRKATGKKARLKRKDFIAFVAPEKQEEPTVEAVENTVPEEKTAEEKAE